MIPETEGPNFEVDNDSLLERLGRYDQLLDQHWATWREEARNDYDMVAGRQWFPEAIAEMEEQNRIPVTFNRIETTIDAVSGAEIMGRQEVTYLPRTVEDTGPTDVLSQGAQYVRQNCDAEDEESDAVRDTLICGMGWTETTVGYEEEEDGQILINRIDPLEMSVDPSSRKANCADMRYLRREIKMSREEAHEFLPGVEDFDLDDRMDARQPTIVDPQIRYKNGMVDESNDEVMIKEYQWFDTEAYYRVQHPMTGEVMEVSLDDIEQAKAINPGVEMGEVRQTRRKYMRCFVAAGRIHDLKEIEAGDFTYKAMTGKRDRNKGTWYGLVRPMKDPQRFANKFFSSMIEQFVKGAKGGVMAEIGAVQDQRQFENSWAQTAEITWVPNGSLSQNRIQEKPVQPISAALPPMLEFSISSIRDVTGVNLELLGMADRQQAGVLEHQRKQAAYGILSAFFNSFRRYRKMQGRLLLKMMKLYLPEGTLARIVGEDGQAKYVPIAYGPETMQYDVIVDEAPTSPNQKERVFAILTQFQGMFADAPPEIIAELIKYSPLPAAVSEKIAGMLNKQPSPEEIQAAQQQQAMQMEAAGQAVRKVASEADKNEAGAALNVAQTRKTDMEAARDLTETIRNDAEAHMMQTVSSIAGNPDV